MNIKHAELDFDSNVVIISGRSASGKSAVFDAIALCLSQKKRSSLYSEYVKQGCNHAKVNLNCDINDEPVNFNLQVNLTKGTPYQMAMTYKNEVYHNTEAEALLKTFDIEYYSDIIFSMQSDDYKDITQLSPTQRSNYLQRLLNFDFQKEKLAIIKVLEEYKVQNQKIENDILLKNEFIKKENDGVEKLIELKLTEKDISDKQNLIKEKQEKISQYQASQIQIADLNNKISLLSKDLLSLNLKENDLNNKINLIEEQKIKFDKTEQKLLEIDCSLTEISKRLKDNKEETDKLEARKNVLRGEIGIVTQRIEYFKKILANYERFASLEEKDKCPLCERETTDFLKEQLGKMLNAEYDGTDAKGHHEFDVLQIKKEAGDTFASICDKIKERITETGVNNMNDELEMTLATEMLRKLAGDKIIDESKERMLKEEKETLEKNMLTIEDNFDNMLTYTSELKELKSEVSSINIDIEKYRKNVEQLSKQEDITLLSKEIVSETNKINAHFTDIKTNKEITVRNKARADNVSKYKKEIKQLSEENTEIITQQNIYEEALGILDKNLPNYMVVKTCASLQNEMNNFIQSIFPLYEVQLINSKKGCEFFYTKDKTVVEQERKRNNAWINSKMSSGFEKALLTIAFKVSLAQLYGINIIIGDEIDGAADDESSEKLFEMLVTNSMFDQIFLISHKRAICRLISDISSNCIMYTAQQGQFTITESLD